MHARITQAGRAPRQVKILTGTSFIFGDTMAEAERMEIELLRLAGGEDRIPNLPKDMGGINLSDLPLDDPIPSDRLIDPEEVNRTYAKDRSLF